MRKPFFFFVFLMWVVSAAWAQIALPSPELRSTSRLFSAAGLSFTTGVGVGLDIQQPETIAGFLKTRFLAYAWHPLPPHHAPENGEIGAGFTFIPIKGRFQVPFRFVVEMRQANNQLSNGAAVATRISLLPSKSFKKTTLSAELGWNRTWATYLVHTARYRQQFPDAVNGWYSSTAGYMLLSAQAERQISRKSTLALQLGFRTPDTFATYGIFLIPWSVQLGYSFALE